MLVVVVMAAAAALAVFVAMVMAMVMMMSVTATAPFAMGMVMVVIVVVMAAAAGVIMGGFAGDRGEISPAFRVKSCFDFNDFGAHAGEKRGNLLVGADAQFGASHLHRQVVVAKLPGNPRKIGIGGGAHFHHRFGLADNLDELAIVENERVPGPCRECLFECQFDGCSTNTGYGAAALGAANGIQHHHISGFAFPGSGSDNSNGAWHDKLPQFLAGSGLADLAVRRK